MALLDDIKTKASDFIKDITTLEVTTLTGNLSTSVIVDSANNNKVDFQKILDSLTPADGAEPSTVEIVAASKIDFDKDIVQYIQKNADSSLVELHNNSLKDSQEARTAFLNAMLNFVS